VKLNNKFEGIMVWHVLAVDDQGVAHVTITATQVADTTNGRVVREPDKTFHVLIDPDGHLLADPGFGTTGAKGNDGPAMPGVDHQRANGAGRHRAVGLGRAEGAGPPLRLLRQGRLRPDRLAGRRDLVAPQEHHDGRDRAERPDVRRVPRSDLPPGGVITFAGTLTFHLESI
jgi:hypothetical protein